MPTYEYLCEDCGKIFTVMMSMMAHEKERVACPGCKKS